MVLSWWESSPLTATHMHFSHMTLKCDSADGELCSETPPCEEGGEKCLRNVWNKFGKNYFKFNALSFVV